MSVSVLHTNFIRTGLAQYVADDLTVHVGQTHVSAAVSEGKLGVIHSEQMQHRGMQAERIPELLRELSELRLFMPQKLKRAYAIIEFHFESGGIFCKVQAYLML